MGKMDQNYDQNNKVIEQHQESSDDIFDSKDKDADLFLDHLANALMIVGEALAKDEINGTIKRNGTDSKQRDSTGVF